MYMITNIFYYVYDNEWVVAVKLLARSPTHSKPNTSNSHGTLATPEFVVVL